MGRVLNGAVAVFAGGSFLMGGCSSSGGGEAPEQLRTTVEASPRADFSPEQCGHLGELIFALEQTESDDGAEAVAATIGALQGTVTNPDGTTGNDNVSGAIESILRDATSALEDSGTPEWDQSRNRAVGGSEEVLQAFCTVPLAIPGDS